MSLDFEKTLEGALELRKALCCESCKKLPDEPHFTSVCQHLLCKECIYKSSSCLVCDAAYYKKEIKISHSLKESILYVNRIINIINNQEETPSNRLEMPAPTTFISQKSSKRAAKSVQSGTQSVPENEQSMIKGELTSSQAIRAKKAKKNDKGETALHLAAINGDLETCKQLISEMNDLNVSDNAGWTPLHEACMKGHVEVTRLLIQHGASINIKGYLDSTPLHEAVIHDKEECVKLLMEHGVDTNIRNTHGFFAKDLAKTSSILKLLDTKNNTQSIITSTHTNASLNTSPERKNRRSTLRKPRQKILLFGTGMTNEEKVRLNELAHKLDLKLSTEMTAHVTHVVSKDGLICQRTINYMKAVLMGKWLLSIKWLEDSLQVGHILEENSYEFQGSHKFSDSKSSYKGRMNACLQNPSLFQGCHFYFHGEFKVFAKNDLIKLVQLGGGKILRREPKLDRLDELMQPVVFHASDSFKCSHFIVYDENKPLNIVKHDYLHTMNINWVFNCIDKFKISVD